MRIAYLLADSDLAGGIRIVLAQADALIDRGHDVELVTTTGPVTWRSTRGRWNHVSSFDEVNADDLDFLIGTFWTTVRDAHRIAGRKAVHLCQGYEGGFTAYRSVKEQIDATYRLPIPKITVSRHLVAICRSFYDDATHIGQIVDAEFYRPSGYPPKQPPRLLLSGQIQGDMKGIDDGYAAVARARSKGEVISLVRVSAWPPDPDEPIENADEFHVALPTGEMTSLMHSCDILLGPNHHEEGFGLPAAEAMASRIPTVLTEIPSYLSLDERHDYAAFAPERDPEALGDQLIAVLRDEGLRARLTQRGAEVAQQFRAGTVAATLEAFFRERLQSK